MKCRYGSQSKNIKLFLIRINHKSAGQAFRLINENIKATHTGYNSCIKLVRKIIYHDAIANQLRR